MGARVSVLKGSLDFGCCKQPKNNNPGLMGKLGTGEAKGMHGAAQKKSTLDWERCFGIE